MSQTGIITPVSSVDGTHFTTAVAQNASEFEAIALPQAVGVDGVGRCRIKDLTIWSTDNLAWEVGIWGHASPKSADPNGDYFMGRWTFVVADGVQEDAAGLFRYYVNGLDILYFDAMNTGRIYLTLVNRSAGAKTAAPAGKFRLRLGCENTSGF